MSGTGPAPLVGPVEHQRGAALLEEDTEAPASAVADLQRWAERRTFSAVATNATIKRTRRPWC